jgi:hypothetical protein
MEQVIEDTLEDSIAGIREPGRGGHLSRHLIDAGS